MKYTPDGYGERCRFDAFCKTVLRNEARTHLRDLGRQRSRETEFSALSQQEMDKLCTVDEYPSDSTLFTAYGYALHIRDELIIFINNPSLVSCFAETWYRCSTSLALFSFDTLHFQT